MYESVFEKVKKDYADQDFRNSFRTLLNTINVEALAIDNIVIMGLGLRYPSAPMSNEKAKDEVWESISQLVFILDLAEYLESETGISIKIFAQDPLFDDTETKFLSTKNVTVIQSEGVHVFDWNGDPPTKQPVEDYLTSSSLIFDCFCPLDTMARIYANSDVAMVIGTNLEASLQTALLLLFEDPKERDTNKPWSRAWERSLHNRIHLAKEFQHSHKYYLLNRCDGFGQWARPPNSAGSSNPDKEILSLDKATLYLRKEDTEQLTGWGSGRAVTVQHRYCTSVLNAAQKGAHFHDTCQLCASDIAEYKAVAEHRKWIQALGEAGMK